MKIIPKNQMSTANALSCEEAVLWDKFKSGDKEAYAIMYEQYADNLFSYGMNILNNRNFVEDAIQDVFVELWRVKKNLGAVKSIKFYLFTCLRRELVKKIKKDNLIASLDILKENHLFSTTSIEDDLIEDDFIQEKNSKVKRVFEGLCKRQQEILYLKFYENQSYQQIAQLLGLDLKYIYNTASKAFNIIKKNFLLIILVIN